MENKEDILDALEEFGRKPNEKLPNLLEEYLHSVAATGEIIFPWPKLKPVFIHKMEQVMNDFHEQVTEEMMHSFPIMEKSKFDEMRQRLLETIGTFNGAPFTIQRLCELLVEPTKHYKRTDKFLRGIEKNVMVVSTVDPFGNKIVNESKFLLNGLDSPNGVDETPGPAGDKASPKIPLCPPAPANSPAVFAKSFSKTKKSAEGSSDAPESSEASFKPLSRPQWEESMDEGESSDHHKTDGSSSDKPDASHSAAVTNKDSTTKEKSVSKSDSNDKENRMEGEPSSSDDAVPVSSGVKSVLESSSCDGESSSSSSDSSGSFSSSSVSDSLSTSDAHTVREDVMSDTESSTAQVCPLTSTEVASSSVSLSATQAHLSSRDTADSSQDAITKAPTPGSPGRRSSGGFIPSVSVDAGDSTVSSNAGPHVPTASVCDSAAHASSVSDSMALYTHTSDPLEHELGDSMSVSSSSALSQLTVLSETLVSRMEQNQNSVLSQSQQPAADSAGLSTPAASDSCEKSPMDPPAVTNTPTASVPKSPPPVADDSAPSSSDDASCGKGKDEVESTDEPDTETTSSITESLTDTTTTVEKSDSTEETSEAVSDSVSSEPPTQEPMDTE